MSDPQTLVDRLDAAEDAFGHVGGRPEFEPELNAAPDAAPGEVRIEHRLRGKGSDEAKPLASES